MKHNVNKNKQIFSAGAGFQMSFFFSFASLDHSYDAVLLGEMW